MSKEELYKQEYYELPPDWEWAPLREICDPLNGRAFKSSEWRETGVPIIRIQNLKDANAPYNYFQGELRENHQVVSGDLLFAWSGTPGTSFGAHIWKGEDAALNQHIFNVKFDRTSVDLKYFLYALNQNVTRYVEQAQGGVGLAHITKSKFLDSSIPLAPLEQQKRIVAEIEKQFSRLDEAVANLKRVKANLKRYKAAVLKAAVEGKLTEKWREDHPEVEPASKLLERILAERRQKWEEAELAKMKAKGLPAPKEGVWWLYVILCNDDSFYIGVTNDLPRRWSEHSTGRGAEWTQKHKPIQIIHHEKFKSQEEAYNREKELKTGYGRKWLKREYEKGTLRQAGKVPKDDKWKKRYKEPAAADVTDLPELPKEWVWVTWESILAHEDGAFKRGPFGSALKKSIFVKAGYKVYEQYCPINDDCSFARYFITEEKFQEMEGFSVKARDFLISCSGVTLGRITQVPDEYDEGVINQALLRVRVNGCVMDDSYFIRFFRSPYFQKQIFKNSQGAAIPNVKGVKELKAIPIPLPPLEEQLAVAQLIDEKMSVVSGIGKQLDTNLKRAVRLRQSILSNAFSGQLGCRTAVIEA